MRLLGLAAAAALAATPLSAPAPEDSRLAIGLICGAERRAEAQAVKTEFVRVDGMGTGGFAIPTRNPEAQAWFDYGLKLAQAFYHEDAKTAFGKAVEADPACAMCLWGQALSLGPTLNFDVPPKDMEQAKALIAKAEGLAAGLSAKDRSLIAALKIRYARPKGTAKAYAKAMDLLAKANPQDDTLAILTAEAWLILGRDGDRQGVERAVGLLKATLERHPDNTGAIHFYIHATEFAGRPVEALAYAERLGGLAPEASHLIHMPAHTLIHVGRYEEVAVENSRALGIEADYGGKRGVAGPLGKAGYYGHNLGFGIAGAMLAGDAPLALKLADHAAIAYPASLPAEQREGSLGRSYVVLGRYDPERALKLAEPPADRAYQRLSFHYARGEAFASRGDALAVRREAAAIGKLKAPKFFIAGQKIARQVLEGRAAMIEGRPKDAAKAFAAAAALQEKAYRYSMDPPAFWYPVRRSLAAARLAAGDYAAAAKEAEASLAWFPNDGLALKVLSEAEARQGKTEAAAGRLAEAKRAWRGRLEAVKLELI